MPRIAPVRFFNCSLKQRNIFRRHQLNQTPFTPGLQSFCLREHPLNARSFKNFQAPPVRSDFNYCHRIRPAVRCSAWLDGGVP
jgi:hypothetical protein